MTPHERKGGSEKLPRAVQATLEWPARLLRGARPNGQELPRTPAFLWRGNGLVAERGREGRGRGDSLGYASSRAGSAAGASQQAASAGCVPRAARQADPLPHERFVVVLQRRVVLPEGPSLKTLAKALERRGG